MTNNWAYALSVEKLAGIEVPERAEYLRVILAELTRLQNHASLLGFLLSDMGAWGTPLMYAFREREKILDLFESLSGSNGTGTGNEILMVRTQGIGKLSAELAINAGITGPMLRASGVNYDLRKVDGYGFYPRFKFRIPLGTAAPYRYRVRPPSLINLTVLEDMCLGHTVADVMVILGSVDIVMGEVDR